MGNKIYAHDAILDKPIEESIGRLYWPASPFEGPVKLRFFCSVCQNESILLTPYPAIWRELVNLKGECFVCGQFTAIHTKFVEAGKTRAAIWVFNGRDAYQLGPQLLKFIRSGPLGHQQLGEMASGEMQFQRVVRPDNFRDTSVLGSDFQYAEEDYGLPLHSKHKVFLKTVNSKLKTWDRWKLEIKRSDNILAQACKAFLEASPHKIRGSLKVKFVGEEIAYDLGGVSREFFQIVSSQMLDPSNNLFLPVGPNNTFHPSPSSSVNETHLAYFRFYGRFMGKALIDQRLIAAPFTRAIWKLLLGKPLSFEDFQTVDKQTYNRLRETLDYDPETLEACGFVFAANIDDFGAGKMYPLKEGGSDIPVTRENLHEWIGLYSAWKMVDSVYEQLRHLVMGFYDVVPVHTLSLFNEYELEQIMCGMNEIDIADWQKHYVALGAGSKSQQSEWFWQVIEELDNTQRGALLQFTTGSAQVPITFEYCNPPFTVCFDTKGLEPNCLPYGHTCFNRLDLPHFTSKENMQKALLTTIELGVVGFAIK